MINSDFLKLYEELSQLNKVKVDTQKSIDFVDNKNKLHEKGHSFVSKFFDKITMPKDIRLAIDVDPIDIL